MDDADPPISHYAAESAQPEPIRPTVDLTPDSVEPEEGVESGEEETSSRSVSSAKNREYHKGPRGGCYTYSESGNKRYVDRSLCD